MAFNELITHPMALPVSLPLLAGLLCLLIPNAARVVRAWLAALAAAVVMARRDLAPERQHEEGEHRQRQPERGKLLRKIAAEGINSFYGGKIADTIEADMIRLALTRYRGQMSEVARKLGIGRSTLYRKMRDLGLEARG